MFGFGKNHVYAIGVDITRQGLRLAQLGDGAQALRLMAGCCSECPAGVDAGTAAWQRWAVETLHLNVTTGGFRGKDVIASIPPGEVLVETMKLPKSDKVEDAIFARIKAQMPSGCTRENALIKYVATDQDGVLVMAAEREVINRHLAVLEKAGLGIRSLAVWPEALVGSYARFFGRRQSDLEAVVILINVESSHTQVVICRHRTLLFARMVPTGKDRLTEESSIQRLTMDVGACRRDFACLYRNAAISRLIFMSGQSVDTSVYATVAKQLDIQAQIADCLVAVEMPESLIEKIDRRDLRVSWATAFGLSLS